MIVDARILAHIIRETQDAIVDLTYKSKTSFHIRIGIRIGRRFRVDTPDGEEVFLAAEGEILAENFRIHRIGYEEVEIGYTQEPFLNERKVLPMGGQS